MRWDISVLSLPTMPDSNSLQSRRAESGTDTVFPVWIILHMRLSHLAKSIASVRPGDPFMDIRLLSVVEKACRPNAHFL
jgi:hypothetical protein